MATRCRNRSFTLILRTIINDGVVKSSDILRCCGFPDTRHTTCMVSRLENHNALSIEIFT